MTTFYNKDAELINSKISAIIRLHNGKKVFLVQTYDIEVPCNEHLSAMDSYSSQ